MTLKIDSAVVELPPLPNETFKDYLNRIAALLLEKGCCIGTCQLDGQTIPDVEIGNELFAKASVLTIDSVPLQVALQANIALQCNSMRKIEDDCESLITDALLADPQQVIVSWSGLCEEVKKILNFIPRLNGLLTDQQVDALIDDRLGSLNAIMAEITEVLAKADVVSFSDLLELKLLPWLSGMREFLQAQLALVESLGAKEAKEA